MAQIKLKRGPSANITSLTLEAGEPAFTLDGGKLYIGDGQGGKKLINPDPGTATAADKLTSPRNFSASGDATAAAQAFDGTQNVVLTLVLANTGVAAGTYTKLTVDAKGRVTSAVQLTAADIPTLTLSKISDAGSAAGKTAGAAAGNVPVLDASGKLPESTLPAIAITDVFEAANQAAMLALTAQTGDICVRSDLNKSYILKASPASTLANWVELRTPTDTVLSVNGKTGVVTLTAADVSAVPTTRTVNGKALTGNISLAAADVGALDANSVIDGGTF